MSSQHPKTIEEHRDYLHAITGLKLFFLWRWAHTHPDEDIAAILRSRIDIYRKTDINDGPRNPTVLHWDDPRWKRIEAAVTELFTRYRDDAPAFEQACMDVIRPHLDARLEYDYHDRTALHGYQCGSLRYEADKNVPVRANFHIANALQPRSIFDDPQYLPDCLRCLMKKSRAEYGCTELGTGTWLNALPAWLAMFPPEYAANLRGPNREIQWHYGYWGQFITRRGTFHTRNAAHLRRTGEFPFYPYYAWCTFEALERHLADGGN